MQGFAAKPPLGMSWGPDGLLITDNREPKFYAHLLADYGAGLYAYEEVYPSGYRQFSVIPGPAPGQSGGRSGSINHNPGY